MQAALHRNREKNLITVAAPDLASLATGSITFPSNPLSNSTITIAGTVITFGTSVAIGATLAITLASLLAFLNASVDANLIKHTYSISGSVLAIKAKSPGVATTTLAASAASVSASTIKLTVIHKRKAL